MKRFNLSALFLCLNTVFVNTVFADPWVTFPGTKARGMGTAFTAVANDPSAAWYNPAGLFQMNGSNISVEYGSAPSYQTSPPLLIVEEGIEQPAVLWQEMSDDNKSAFLSFNKGNGTEWGFSFYYYQPYFIEGSAVNSTGSLFGDVSEEVQILGFGFAKDVFLEERNWFPKFHLGGTLEVVSTDVDNTKLTLDGRNFNFDSVDIETGLSGSIGFLTTLYEPDKGISFAPVFKIGGVYRFESSADIGSTNSTFTVDGRDVSVQDLFNSKPASWNLGTSARIPLRLKTDSVWSLELSADYGETEFDGALRELTYSKLAFGGSLRWTLDNENFVRQIEVRGGIYNQEEDTQANNIIDLVNQSISATNMVGDIYPDVKGQTLGVQLVFGSGLILEFAHEERTLENTGTCFVNADTICDFSRTLSDLDEDFVTAAIRYHW